MNKLFLVLATVMIVVINACSEKAPAHFVYIKGGAFKNNKSNYYGKSAPMHDFYIGKYEVTQKEWQVIMGSNPATFKGNELPVETVSWYDCIEYCNKRSILEGLQPYYTIEKNKKDPGNNNELDDMKWMVTINAHANGYRLPTEVEWEYAAGGGQLSKGYIYSGGNSIDEIAWYWKNSGNKYLTGYWVWAALEKNNNKTKPVGSKSPNELGLYDMSGNVREWCWDRYLPQGADTPQGRIWKGGGWMGADFCCEPSFRADYQANGKGPDQGFRICRNVLF
ncbi:formylglycine-generating enzyme family protein [Longitalea luteola]|uniref:formylglycine-generating enzyme family protein n=1 Tax=Longitalea luteola TaxID=2812563 RepID=UPI001A976B9F|nr:SUMF1/EgtB/PvdO family nonheme iron enzyme [Longitalea luteola]